MAGDKPPGGPGETGVSVVIPARNEASRVGATVTAVRGLPGVGEVIVVDDASTDGTGQAAAAAGARVVRLARPGGKGAALACGFQLARGRVLVCLDADLGPSAGAAAALWEALEATPADLAVACLPPALPGAGGFGLARGLATWGVRRLTGFPARAPLSGQRALRREVWEAVGSFSPGWGAEVGFLIDALRAGFRVVEVEVPFTHRPTGRNLAGFLHRAAQFRDIARALWARRGRG